MEHRKKRSIGLTKYECSKCNNQLEPARYGKYRYCRDCHAEYMRLNRKDEYKNLSPIEKKKYSARKIVAIAVRKGSLIKSRCVVCGELEVEGHHEDYDKPKEVIWLCRKHHLERHGIFVENDGLKTTEV